MIIIDDFLKGSYSHGELASDLIDGFSFFNLVRVLWLESFLVLNELLFEQDVVLDAFLAEKSQTAL